MKDQTNRPIAIFDSGIGGLTVVKEVIDELPYENIVYLGDTARVPYGPRDPETITHFSLEMLKFLIEEKPKVIVVACNTINAVCFDAIQDISPVPVIGIIDPTIHYALNHTKTGHIGVIGTTATINSGIYEQEIHSIHSSAKITSKACPLFVPLVEEHWLDDPATYMIAEEYLARFKRTAIDTMILGCTHYPILEKVIGEVLGPKVNLVNSGRPTAKALRKLLESKHLLSDKREPTYQFYVTAVSDTTAKSANTFFKNEFPGELEKVVLPHISKT